MTRPWYFYPANLGTPETVKAEVRIDAGENPRGHTLDIKSAGLNVTISGMTEGQLVDMEVAIEQYLQEVEQQKQIAVAEAERRFLNSTRE